MPFKIGALTGVAVGDIKKVDLAIKADTNQDGVLQAEEAAVALAQLTGDQKTSSPLQDFVKLAGGTRHAMRMYTVRANPDYMSCGMYAKGDFHSVELNGVYGNVSTCHFDKSIYTKGYDKPPKEVSILRFAVNCDGFPIDFFQNDIESAMLVLSPKGFPQIDKTSVAEAVNAPLDLLYEPSRWVQEPRSSTWHALPEAKFMAIDVAREDLAKLAGTSGGVEFYIQVKMKDGRTVSLNRDGVPGQNWELKSSEEFQGIGPA
jgi:hypothetical protein